MPAAGADSLLLFDKPAGKTSHDIVLAVRREHRGQKVGHAGTLDPFATGLLLILIGRATRLQRFLVELPKTYVARARLGWRSSTGDPDGELRETGRTPSALDLPTGRVRQRVPMTSAVRVGGERLYRKAHRGEVVETPEREVEVYRAELRRTAIGPFRVENAGRELSLDQISELVPATAEALR
jgi:tRNA pseudouridine55 synthase